MSDKKTILIKFHNLSHTVGYMQILTYSDDNISSFSTKYMPIITLLLLLQYSSPCTFSFFVEQWLWLFVGPEGRKLLCK
jgi:hypothetical protein